MSEVETAAVPETCRACIVGWHIECIYLEEHPTNQDSLICCCWQMKSEPVESPSSFFSEPKIDTRRAQKADEDIKDQTSTGRKRAAEKYPLPPVSSGGMKCEWAYLSRAGGGAAPIVGCRGNMIADTKDRIMNDDGSVAIWPGNVHHGPDKSTLNNNPDNVSRVCPVCHNRWHTLNDPLYGDRPDAGQAYLPLSGICHPLDNETLATEEELAWSDSYWALEKRKRAGLPYRLEEVNGNRTS